MAITISDESALNLATFLDYVGSCVANNVVPTAVKGALASERGAALRALVSKAQQGLRESLRASGAHGKNPLTFDAKTGLELHAGCAPQP